MPAGLPGTEYLDPLYQDRLAAERKRAIAEQLAMQAAQPLDSGGTVYRGRAPAPLHWSQSLAKVFAAALAGRQDKKAFEAEQGLAGKRLAGAQAAESTYNANRTQMPEQQLPPRTRFENGAETVVQGPTLEGIGDTSQAAPAAIGDPFATPELKARAQIELAMAERDRARQEAQNYQLGRDRRSDIETRANRELTLAAQREAKLRDETLRRDLADQADQTRRDLASNRPEAAPAYRDILDPKDPTRLITVDGRLYQPGGSIGDPGVIGVAGKEPGAAKAAETRGTGLKAVDEQVANLRDLYDQLDEGGGITNPDKGMVDNITASIASSPVGQMAGKVVGTKNQSARNQVAQQRPLLLRAIMQATGMSARSLDSNAELKLWLSAATDPTLDVSANRAALDNIERQYGTLSLGEGERAPTSPAAPAADQDKERRYQEWKARQK